MQNDLISRSALGIGRCNPDAFPEQNRGYVAGWNGVIALIEAAPAVDAVELTEEEAVLLFSIATQIVQDMEVQGRASLYPRKYATFQEIKRKLCEHIGERRAEK